MSAPTAPVPVLTAPARRSSSLVGLAIGLLSALSFASSGSFMKPLMEAGWSLGATLLLRMGGAALILAPVLIVTIRRRPGFLRKHGLLIVAFGLTGVAGCQIFYFAALQRMPVAMALLIQYLAPVLLVGLAWVRTRRAPSRRVLAGSVLAIAGLVLVVDIAGASFDLIGTLLALGAAACTAAYFLIAEKTGDDIPPLALASGGLITGALLMGVLVGTGLLAFTAPAVDIVLAGVSMPWYIPIVWVIVVATAGGYAFGVRAGSMLGSRVASFVGLTEVLFALLIAWLVIAEVPTAMQAVGGAMILAGVILVRSDPGVAAKEEAASVPLVPAP
ncbi:EamA family transporter [Microbacterium schleiferi]|uniref:EamA family transporter n=1 Tax=Microbacterium schleiferi TaxID=69362 RepID=A0A7S8MZU7_9MICO|nr:DMT family transporter [Microbacterium schleiferi]QPE05763.1 EamA family transporter [Microbacterium schleiferi]